MNESWGSLYLCSFETVVTYEILGRRSRLKPFDEHSDEYCKRIIIFSWKHAFVIGCFVIKYNLFRLFANESIIEIHSEHLLTFQLNFKALYLYCLVDENIRPHELTSQIPWMRIRTKKISHSVKFCLFHGSIVTPVLMKSDAMLKGRMQHSWAN